MRNSTQVNSIVEITELATKTTEVIILMDFLIPVGDYSFPEFAPYWITYLKNTEGQEKYETDPWYNHTRKFVSYLLSFCPPAEYNIVVR